MARSVINITVTLSPDDLSRLNERVVASGMSRSAYCRWMILGITREAATLPIGNPNIANEAHKGIPARMAKAAAAMNAKIE